MALDNLSGTGISIRIAASKTFPTGFTVTGLADDADPLAFEDQEIANVGMNVNGEMAYWSVPTPRRLSINVWAGSESDENLCILMDANTAMIGKMPVGDEITMIVSYPDGSSTSAFNGKLLSGNSSKSVGQDGKLKAKAFAFAFQDFGNTRKR